MNILFLLICLLCPFLRAGCFFSPKTELERLSRALYTQKAEKILKKSVVFVHLSSALPQTQVPPREYHIKVTDADAQQKAVTVADYLKTCNDGDREYQALLIITYFLQREVAQIMAEFKISNPTWLVDRKQNRVVLTLDCMMPFISN